MNTHESQPDVSLDATNTAPRADADEAVDQEYWTIKFHKKYSIWFGLLGFAFGILSHRSYEMQNTGFVDALLVIVAWVGAVLYLSGYRKAQEPELEHLRSQFRLWGLITLNVFAAGVTVYWILKHLLELF